MGTRDKKALILSIIFFAVLLGIFVFLAVKNRPETKEPVEPRPLTYEKLPDSDGDGLLDFEEERFYSTNPKNPDTDDDSLSDREEVEIFFTNPNKKDTDHDKFTDPDELKNGYNPVGPGLLTAEQKEALERKLEQLNIIFPDQYLLKQNEQPPAFTLKPITPAQAALYGSTGNPGFYGLEDESSNNLTFGYLYNKPGTPEKELGVFVIKYYFKQEIPDSQLESEWKKIYDTTPRILLRKRNTLIYIWSDTSEYVADMRFVADKLKQRLNLTEIASP